MTRYGPDIYTEPDGDPDTSRTLDPCGRWPESGKEARARTSIP